MLDLFYHHQQADLPNDTVGVSEPRFLIFNDSTSVRLHVCLIHGVHDCGNLMQLFHIRDWNWGHKRSLSPHKLAIA